MYQYILFEFKLLNMNSFSLHTIGIGFLNKIKIKDINSNTDLFPDNPIFFRRPKNTLRLSSASRTG